MAKTKEKAKEKTTKAKVVAKVKKPEKKKEKRIVPRADVHVKCTYNNTIITFCDLDGGVLSSSSAGVVGFKGTKKSTAYAATKAAEDAYEKAKKYGVVEASVKVEGSGMGRQAAIKGMRAAGLRMRTLMDVTPIPHGGCAPRKQPRGS